MQKIDNPLNLDQSRSPWISLFSLFLMVLGGTIIFGFLLSTLILFPMGIESMTEVLSNMGKDMDPRLRSALLIFQGSASAGGFILAPLLFLFIVAKVKPANFFGKGRLDISAAVITVVLVITFMVINAPIIEWNSNIKFPSFLAEFEHSALEKEIELAELTEILTTFDSLAQFLLGMLVIAVIPAIGEEFLFRGLIQNYFLKLSSNYHIAIWASAIIFGAFHLQFYGVFPRILLGALFGYLYVWSGSLWLAVLAHFVNNGFTLIMSYLYQKGGVGYNIQDTSLPPLYMILIALILFTGLVYGFRKQYFVKE